MARESALSIKEKWALDAQLGEMLRGLDAPASKDQKFKKRLNALIDEFGISSHEVVEILGCMSDRMTEQS